MKYFLWKNENFEKKLKLLNIVPIVIPRWKSCSKLNQIWIFMQIWKNMKNFMMCQWNIFSWKHEKFEKNEKYLKSFLLWFYGENLAQNWNRFDISYKFEKIMKNFMMCQFVHHETFVCHEPSELESSTSLPGGNLVDGLPPVVSWGRGRFEIFLWFLRNFV